MSRAAVGVVPNVTVSGRFIPSSIFGFVWTPAHVVRLNFADAIPVINETQVEGTMYQLQLL